MSIHCWMKAKFDGKCAECGEAIQAREQMCWDVEARKGYCKACGEEAFEPAPATMALTSRWPKVEDKPADQRPCIDCNHYLGWHDAGGCIKCPCMRRPT